MNSFLKDGNETTFYPKPPKMPPNIVNSLSLVPFESGCVKAGLLNERKPERPQIQLVDKSDKEGWKVMW